jgi:hypothetical protein
MPFSFVRDSALCLVIIFASNHFKITFQGMLGGCMSHIDRKLCRSDHYMLEYYKMINVIATTYQTAIYYYNIDHHDLKILFINH